jgi:hypothetical protein
MGTGDRHAYLDGQAVSLCDHPILDPTDIDWPGPGLGSPRCEACQQNANPGADAAVTPRVMATDRKQIRTIRRIYIALFGNFVMLYRLVSGWDVACCSL